MFERRAKKRADQIGHPGEITTTTVDVTIDEMTGEMTEEMTDEMTDMSESDLSGMPLPSL